MVVCATLLRPIYRPQIDFRAGEGMSQSEHRYIVVEGPIGVGKSSLTNILSERFAAQPGR
jgi:polynucleotide 5'-kinase involved in rRNA processing